MGQVKEWHSKETKGTIIMIILLIVIIIEDGTFKGHTQWSRLSKGLSGTHDHWFVYVAQHWRLFQCKYFFPSAGNLLYFLKVNSLLGWANEFRFSDLLNRLPRVCWVLHTGERDGTRKRQALKIHSLTEDALSFEVSYSNGDLLTRIDDGPSWHGMRGMVQL